MRTTRQSTGSASIEDDPLPNSSWRTQRQRPLLMSRPPVFLGPRVRALPASCRASNPTETKAIMNLATATVRSGPTETATSVSAVRVYGEILEETGNLRSQLRWNPAAIIDWPGEFSIAWQEGPGTKLLCSRNGVSQLFYCCTPQGLYFGGSVLEVVREAGLAWEWNWRSLACLAYFGHTIGEDTLHSRVQRVGTGQIVSWRGGELSKTSLAPPRKGGREAPTTTVEALCRFVEKHGSDDAVLSMSAGFDSRVLLACFLECGTRPRLLIIGQEGATDAQVVERIAFTFGLPLQIVDVPASDYLRYRRRIVSLTSGTQTWDHWHTYIYGQRAGLTRDDKLFLESNGMFARGCYLDRGLPSLAAAAMGFFDRQLFWSAKLRRHVPLLSAADGLASELDYWFHDGRGELLAAITKGYDLPLSVAFDEFYLRERVRSFVSNDLAVVSDVCRPRAPFLDSEWINALRRLPRQFRLGSRWHRLVLKTLCPTLLNFPDDDTTRPMGSRLRVREWLGGAGHGPTTHSVDYDSLLRSRDFLDYLFQAVGSIETVIEPEKARHWIRKCLVFSDRQAAIAVSRCFPPATTCH